jgi:osmotically inducible lipoprotein OsmB
MHMPGAAAVCFEVMRPVQQFRKVNTMKSRILAAALAAASMIGLSGCATMDRTTVGTVGGAVVGGLVGNAVAGTGGAIIGGAAGAYVGNQAAKR